MTIDLKVALRKLRKSPGFTVTAILTLALGIGANAVVFSVLNAVVLHPLNVPDAKNLYMVQHFQYPSQSIPDYRDLRDRNHTFESLISYNIMGPAGVETGGNPITAWPYEVSGNYFDALGIHPYLGAFFHGSDEHGANSAPFLVLSYALWHTQFHDDRGIIGRTLRGEQASLHGAGRGAAGVSRDRVVLRPGVLCARWWNSRRWRGTTAWRSGAITRRWWWGG